MNKTVQLTLSLEQLQTLHLLERVHINAQRPSFGEFCAFLR